VPSEENVMGFHVSEELEAGNRVIHVRLAGGKGFLNCKKIGF
jgi:hypothetical protein